jgi:hypothetical protein
MGSFWLMPLADLVEFLARRKATGALTCERGTVRKTIYLRQGEAVGAASNDPREFLGQLLINFGHLGEEQLAKAFQTQEQTKIRLGKVLTMVGLVPPGTIREVLAIKIRETLLDPFLWDSGVFYVEDGPALPSDELEVSVPLPDIAREAEFRTTAWSAFRARFPTGAASLVIDESKIPASANDDTVDGKLLMLAVEGKTIDEIGLALHATDFHLYQRLYALARQGVLSPQPLRAAPEAAVTESAVAADLAEEVRSLVAAGRLEEAEVKVSRAAAVAPGLEAARGALASAQRALLAELRVGIERAKVPALRLPPHQIALLRLSSAEKYLLSRCDGERTLRHILQVAPLSELEVLKAFRKFLGGGILELR